MIKRRRKRYRLKKWVKKTLFLLIMITVISIAIPVYNKYFKVKEEEPIPQDISGFRMAYNNTDIMAKITIENIGIDALVTKTTDNDFYLEHDINNKKNEAGNPFFDYRNNNDLAHEKQINVYSHNVRNKQYGEYYPFSKLEKLLDSDTFNKTDEILIYTDNRILKYQILAVKVITSKENEHMRITTTNSKDWKAHLDKLLSNYKYCKNNCKYDEKDDILVLQTCYYQTDDSYIIVIAKKV